jgi:ribosomal protein L11 methyltransferase
MCLRALPELVIPGASVLDVGTGSGILAIAAAKLGARHVLGVDTDAQAILAARENVAQNEVDDRVEIQSGSLEIAGDGAWHVVIVNILAPVIVGMLQGDGQRRQLLKRLRDDGYLLLSGIIDRQEEEVLDALAASGATVVKTRRVRDWVSLVARRAG